MNGNTYTNGRGNVVVVEVEAGSVESGGASVEVVTGTVAVSVACGATVAAEHPAVNTQATANQHDAVLVRRSRDLPLRPMKHLACVAFGIAVLAAGCNVDEGSATPDTLAPLGSPSNTIPPSVVTTVPPSTTQPPTSTIVLPGGACVFSAPPASPEITFEVGTRLYTVNPATSATSCLTELTLDNVGPLRWSPAGDRVLLNSVTVFDGTQALQSGYLATNSRVSWSYPTGQALIAPAVADSHLLWRTAGKPETRTDISFLERTDVAAYHPAGRNIFAAGQSADGTVGLFIAGNRGQIPRVIARVDESGTVVTEIGPDPSGSRVYFVHDHKNGTFHIHALEFPGLAVTDVVQSAEPIARLTVGTTADAAISWRLGDCAGLTRTQISNGQSPVDQPTVFAALSTEPVGWLDTQQLLLSVRTIGCTGPSDLWVWNTANAAATPLIASVDYAAIRSVFTSFGELPGDKGNLAPD
jgi:hypothetical protein